MKKIVSLLVLLFIFCESKSQNADSLSSEKNLREKILADIQSNLDRKNKTFDSTISNFNSRVDDLDSAIKTTNSVRQKADKLAERVQILEDKQHATEANEVNIYEANYQSAVVNLVSMDREIKPLILFNSARTFYSKLNEAGNPMNYKGYQEWFAKFDKYLADNKSNEMLLDISNNLLTFSGTAANAVPVVGPMSTVLFASMTSYMASINRRDKQMHDESEKMITLTMKVSQFDYDKGEVEHEWEVITDELKNLQDLYSKALASNLSMLKIDATTFDQAFSNEGDAEKRYQYLTMIRQRAGDYVAQQKIDSPKDWKEIVYNQMMLIQSLKMRFGQITFNINENISKYSYVFDKYKTDNDIGPQMSALQENLTSLKDTFDKAFDPMDYINSATRMYKVM